MTSDVATPENSPPFLTVSLRPAGHSAAAARDTLLSLAAQTSQDFEVLLRLEGGPDSVTGGYRDLVDTFDPDFAHRVRLIVHKSATSALVEMASRARGRYIATMDVPDVAFGNWVEAFKRAAKNHAGKVLYSMTAVQPFDVLRQRAEVAYVSTGRPSRPWPQHLDVLAFLEMEDSASGTLGLALPRSAVVEAASFLIFQPAAIEDWGIAIASSLMCGVTDTGEVTYLRRLLSTTEKPTLEPTREEWARARLDIMSGLDPHSLSMPGRALRTLELQRDEIKDLQTRLADLKAGRDLAEGTLVTRARQLDEMRSSASWRLSKPVRVAGSIARTLLRPK